MSAPIRDPREVVRDEMVMHATVMQALDAGPMTIPELADRLGRPQHEVLVWVMGMRRFGWLREEPGAVDGYFRYAALPREVTE